MIKYMFCVKKREDITQDEFVRHSKEVHAPIVSKLPGLRKYVISYSVTPQPTEGTLNYDLVAEVWFDDAEAFQAALGSPIGQEAQNDRPKFLDDSLTRWIAVEEHQIL